MKIIKKTYNLKPYTSGAFELYFGGLSVGVLDIETTGLSPKNSQFILGGFLKFTDGGKAEFSQYFAEALSEEAEALKAYIKEIDTTDVVVTYNGKHFDLSYMYGRLRDLSLHFDDISRFSCFPYNLDLYLVANGFSPLRKLLPNLKQKSVENYLGLWSDRSDEIDGGESVRLYGEFLAMKMFENEDRAEECLRQILLHNSDDVLQLSRLVRLIEKCDFHKAMSGLGFPCGKSGGLLVDNIKLSSKELIISGTQRKNPIGYMAFSDADRPYSFNFDKYSLSFEVSLPLLSKGKLVFTDLTEVFGYVPEELSAYPACESGYLALKADGETYYRELNHFIKLLLLKTENEIK